MIRLDEKYLKSPEEIKTFIKNLPKHTSFPREANPKVRATIVRHLNSMYGTWSDNKIKNYTFYSSVGVITSTSLLTHHSFTPQDILFWANGVYRRLGRPDVIDNSNSTTNSRLDKQLKTLENEQKTEGWILS
jgi:hypothetical protein